MRPNSFLIFRIAVNRHDCEGDPGALLEPHQGVGGSNPEGKPFSSPPVISPDKMSMAALRGDHLPLLTEQHTQMGFEPGIKLLHPDVFATK